MQSRRKLILRYIKLLLRKENHRKERLLWGMFCLLMVRRVYRKQLEKDFRNAAYATIRMFVMKFHEMGLLTARKAETGCSIVSVGLLTVGHYNESKGERYENGRVVAAVICDSMQESAKSLRHCHGYGDYKEASGSFRALEIEPGENPAAAPSGKSKKNWTRKSPWESSAGQSEYDYPAFHLSMDCFWCEVISGDLF